MDELFTDSPKALDAYEAEVEEIEEVDESTALLSRARERERRRSSFAGFN